MLRIVCLLYIDNVKHNIIQYILIVGILWRVTMRERLVSSDCQANPRNAEYG